MDMSSPVAWLSAILEDADKLTFVCKRVFRRFDVDGRDALDPSKVQLAAEAASAQFGLDSPCSEKLQQAFRTLDKTGTHSLSSKAFSIFFKGLLRGIHSKLIAKSDLDLCIAVSAISLSGEDLASVQVPAGSTILQLKKAIAAVTELDPSLMDLTCPIDSGTLLEDAAAVGESLLGLEWQVQVVFRAMYRWRCSTCETINDAVMGEAPFYAFTERCATCTLEPSDSELEVVSKIKQEHREKALLRLDDARISEAFMNITLGVNSPSLHEAMDLDWGGDGNTTARDMSRHDERLNWQRIPEAAEKQAANGQCRCGCRPGSSVFQNTCGTLYPFSFFDSDAVRFHLPAYLIAALTDAQRAEELVEMGLDNFKVCDAANIMNAEQRAAIANCLGYFVEAQMLPRQTGYVAEDKLKALRDCHFWWANWRD